MSNPYAQPADLANFGLPSSALGTLTATQIQDALDSAAGTVDSYLRGRYALPLLAPIPVEITEATCKVAAWRLLAIRGFNPLNPGDAAIRDSYLDTSAWLGRVQRQAAHPNVVQSSDGGQHQQPTVISSSVTFLNNGGSQPNRGW